MSRGLVRVNSLCRIPIVSIKVIWTGSGFETASSKGRILAKMGRLGWAGRVTHMLTKVEITSPVSAIRCSSALSRGVTAVLINFFLKFVYQLGVLGV